MFIRIYYNECFKDISLADFQRFSIGGDVKDGFRIENSDLIKEHIRLTKKNGEWEASCIGEVYLNGNKVNKAILAPDQIFILSKKCRISMLVIKEYSTSGVSMKLNVDEITIGRDDKCNIVLSSPIVSSRHAKIKKMGSNYHIIDTKSMNGTYVNAKTVSDSVLKNNDEIAIGDCKLVRNGNLLCVYGNVSGLNINKAPVNDVEDGDGRILFKRSPRLRLEVPEGTIEIQSPPSIGSKPELDKITMFLPLMVTVALAILVCVVCRDFRMAAYTLPMQCVSGFMSFRNYKKQTRQYDEKEEIRLKKYTDHLEQATEEIEEKRQEQLAALLQSDPDTNDCFDIVNKRARRLWERRPSDSDFMNIRVGSGEIDFSMTIQIPKSSLSLEEDELKSRAQEIYNKYNNITNAPITCSLMEFPICGIIGSQSDTAKLINNMIAQVSTHHFYNEVKVVSIYDKMSAKDFEWFKYLPHTHDTESGHLLISKTKSEAEACFKTFDELFKTRRMSLSNDNSYAKPSVRLPFYLFVISAPGYLAKNNPMNDHLFRSKNLGLGIGVIFAVEDIEQLPPECEMIIELRGGSGQLYNKDSASTKQKFVIDATTNTDFDSFGRKLKPIYCEDTDTKNNIPTKYSLYEMLGIEQVRDLDIEHRWKISDVVNNVKAPLGTCGQDELLYLDLHEKAHGPHGLVAGTTGSGKSEVMLSYILSLAVNYHPYEVSFVIIDFKGGEMAERISKLPHFIDSISNMNSDGKEMSQSELKTQIARSLSSIRAEYTRRQKLVAEKLQFVDGKKDINVYLDNYKKGKVDTPLPHLVLIVDEFAELKKEHPEFIAELVSIARLGRYVGIHLLLSTQQPSGVISDEIQTNSNFRICLRMRDESDSNAVVKSPLAASISTKNKGRGYLQVGNNEIFELFQSGYGGVYAKNNFGKDSTQSDSVIEHICEYCEDKGIKKLQGVCLPPLPSKLMMMKNSSEKGYVPIGLFDNPEGQYQGDYSINVFSDNTMIIGSAQSGKTNLLQTIIRTLSGNYSPDEISMYIIDFSSMILKSFESLNHVGGVVTSAEDEKLKNLFKLLNAEIEKRKEKQLSVGVSSFAAYKEAGNTDMPQIVVVIDNLTSLKEMYFQDDDVLLNLCAEGTTYGITFIIANAQTSGIGYKYLAHFGNRVALYCNDSSEYMSLFEHCKERIDDIPGRALIAGEKTFYECQTYLAFEGEKEYERANSIKKFISEINNRYKNAKATSIPSVPELIRISDVENLSHKIKNGNYSVVFGIDYTTVEPLIVDMNSIGMFGISGREASGKNNFIKYLVRTFDKIYPNKTDIYIVDSINRKLADISSVNNVKSYEILADKAKENIVNVEKELGERYSALASGNNEILTESKLILLVINSVEILDELCADAAIVTSLRNITGKYKNLNLAVIVGNYENKNIPYGANEFVKKIKEDKHILFFDNLTNLKVFDTALTVMRQFKKPIELGDCYYIRDNEYVKVKTILNE